MSGEIMSFPVTVEEFMEQYKMVDKEQIYSNGTEYVPIFRMKQWFEHQKQMPSAQHELTKCKDCKHGSPNGKYGCKVYHYRRYETHEMKPDDFCSRAERRIDGVLDMAEAMKEVLKV